MSKIALITGATSGIGEATAHRLAADGYSLILTGRREDRLDEVSTQIAEQYEVDILTLCFDIRDREEVNEAIDFIPEEFLPIDVLVNNAGLASGLSLIQDGDIEDWEAMIDTNVKGLLYITRRIAPMMAERRQGHIVNIGSIAGLYAYEKGNVYCATKFAVNALSQSLRVDLLRYNVRVTEVKPGMVDTEFSLVRFHGDQAKADSTYDGLQPLSGKDVANVISWVLAQPAHVNINDIVVTPTAQANAYYVDRKL